MKVKEFAEKDPVFRFICEEAGVEPTVRQAKKFRRCKGAAYQAMVKRRNPERAQEAITCAKQR